MPEGNQIKADSQLHSAAVGIMDKLWVLDPTPNKAQNAKRHYHDAPDGTCINIYPGLCNLTANDSAKLRAPNQCS